MNDRFRDRGTEFGHALCKPRRHTPDVKRKIRDARPFHAGDCNGSWLKVSGIGLREIKKLRQPGLQAKIHTLTSNPTKMTEKFAGLMTGNSVIFVGAVAGNFRGESGSNDCQAELPLSIGTQPHKCAWVARSKLQKRVKGAV
jgi:hypothetical protein